MLALLMLLLGGSALLVFSEGFCVWLSICPAPRRPLHPSSREGCREEVPEDEEGYSALANTLAAIKTARYYEMGEDDATFTVATDPA